MRVRPPRRLLPVLACLAALLAALVLHLAGCDGAGSVQGTIPDAALAEAPWEQAFAPDELTEEISGVVMEYEGLEPGATLVPTPGARVELSVPRPDGRRPFVKVGETTTGADGSWKLGKVPRGAWAIRVEKAGRTPAVGGSGLRVHEAADLTSVEDHTLILQRPRTLTGKVVTRDGRPMAGVPVEAVGITFADTATSGADGSFEFHPPDAPVRVSLRGTTCDVDAKLIGPETSDVRLETLPVGEFAGRIVAAEDLRPVAGARIVSLDDPSFRATADGDGRFRLPMPRAGWIAAYAAGRAWRPYRVPVAGDLEMPLHAAPTVTGTVVGADGKPIEGARLVGLSTDTDGRDLRVDGPRSGADGRFEFSWVGLPPAWSKKRAAIVAWHRVLGVSEAVVLPATGPVTLRLGGLGTVRGTLADAAGKPVAGAEAVVAWRLDPLDEDETLTLGIVRERRARTAADGSFEVHGVPLRRNRFVHVEAFGVRLEKVLEPDAATDGIRFELPTGKRLAGRVVDWKGGEPGSPARVTVRLLDVPGVSYARATETGPDGRFEFTDVPPGRYSLEAEAKDFDIRGGNAGTAGEGDVILTVKRSALLKARLVPESGGVPPVPLTFWVDDLDRQGQAASRKEVAAGAADGEFPIASLHPGRYRVRVDGELWRGRVEEIVLSDGERRTVDVPIRRTLLLRATLLDEQGQPMSGVRLDVGPVAGTPGQPLTATSGDGGAVEVPGVLPGRWEVRAAPPSRAPLSVIVTLPADKPFEFRLPPSGEVTVRVRTADGGPAKDAIVGVESADGAAVYAWGVADTIRPNVRFRVGDDGTVTIRGLPVGRLRVRVSVAGDRTKLEPREIVVEAGKPVTVDVP